ITDSSYKGDTIFLSAPEKYQETSPVVSNKYLASDMRLHLPYQVLKFDANHLEVATNNNAPQAAWLFYSDVWHPLWRATVNGKDTPVFKANLAYKAVKIEPGPNKVHFYFKSRLMSFIYLIFGLNALGWLGIILYLNGKIAWNPPPMVK
ncbi:MAG: YfhO family protein, partial [Deltaproteobacteria bacterium]|nr:YfhO family protein [Deltaproteobacteria bacterium]